MDLTSWNSQLRKGAAELAVLVVVSDGERYGLQILQQANGGGEVVSEGALYPLLNRLEKDGKLASRWETADGPHPRKYYNLTADGRQLLAVMQVAWRDFTAAVNHVLGQTQ